MVYQAIEDIPDNASDFYIQVPEVFLSKPYELVTGDQVMGRVIKVQKEKEIPQLKDFMITLILQKDRCIITYTYQRSIGYSILESGGLLLRAIILE